MSGCTSWYQSGQTEGSIKLYTVIQKPRIMHNVFLAGIFQRFISNKVKYINNIENKSNGYNYITLRKII